MIWIRIKLLVLVQYYTFIKHLWNVCQKLQGHNWLPKTGKSRNAARCRCQAAPSILQKSGGPCPPPASYAPVMPYLCSQFYAEIKFYISIKPTTSIEHKSVTYHATLLKFHTNPWDFFQQDQQWLKNQYKHLGAFYLHQLELPFVYQF